MADTVVTQEPAATDWVRPPLGIVATLLANALCAAVIGFAAWKSSSNRIAYLVSVQEDQWVEWATFFAFVLAALLFAFAARAQRRTASRVPWFVIGLGLFCLIVALEEISWGQRLVGYRPPEYFLANNIQQELNLHNLANAGLRSVAFNGILLGYGVLLPGLALVRPDLLRRLAVVSPPFGLFPSFLLTAIVWNWYPLQFTGEWVELMMGLGFMFAALAIVVRGRAMRSLLAVSCCYLVVIGSGFAAAAASNRAADPSSDRSERAQVEAVALLTDIARLEPPCAGASRIHRRVYTHFEELEAVELLSGHFAGLVASGLPESRARYFLDPWDSAYWILCMEFGKGWTTIVYSYGPNRRRETSGSMIAGDDVGAVVKPDGTVVPLTRPAGRIVIERGD